MTIKYVTLLFVTQSVFFLVLAVLGRFGHVRVLVHIFLRIAYVWLLAIIIYVGCWTLHFFFCSFLCAASKCHTDVYTLSPRQLLADLKCVSVCFCHYSAFRSTRILFWCCFVARLFASFLRLFCVAVTVCTYKLTHLQWLGMYMSIEKSRRYYIQQTSKSQFDTRENKRKFLFAAFADDVKRYDCFLCLLHF